MKRNILLYILLLFLVAFNSNEVELGSDKVEKNIGKLLQQYEQERREKREFNFGLTKNYHLKFFEVYYKEIQQLNRTDRAKFLLLSILYLEFDDYSLEAIKKIIKKDCEVKFRKKIKKYLYDKDSKRVNFVENFFNKIDKNQNKNFLISSEKEFKINSFKSCKEAGYRVDNYPSNDEQKVCISKNKIFIEDVFGFIANMSYYNQLSIKCQATQSSSCCLSSVESMYKRAYFEKDKESCPNGFYQNKLGCDGSLIWCEPIEVIKDLKKKRWHISKSDLPKVRKNNFRAYYIFSWEKIATIQRGMAKEDLIKILEEDFNIYNIHNDKYAILITISPSGVSYEVSIKFSKNLRVEDMSFKRE